VSETENIDKYAGGPGAARALVGPGQRPGQGSWRPPEASAF